MANKKNEPQTLSETIVVRVSPTLKEQYEDMAHERTKPNQKAVGIADLAREALVDFVKGNKRELSTK